MDIAIYFLFLLYEVARSISQLRARGEDLHVPDLLGLCCCYFVAQDDHLGYFSRLVALEPVPVEGCVCAIDSVCPDDVQGADGLIDADGVASPVTFFIFLGP